MLFARERECVCVYEQRVESMATVNDCFVMHGVLLCVTSEVPTGEDSMYGWS